MLIDDGRDLVAARRPTKLLRRRQDGGGRSQKIAAGLTKPNVSLFRCLVTGARAVRAERVRCRARLSLRVAFAR